jgi:hypothetical protein
MRSSSLARESGLALLEYCGMDEDKYLSGRSVIGNLVDRQSKW